MGKWVDTTTEIIVWLITSGILTAIGTTGISYLKKGWALYQFNRIDLVVSATLAKSYALEDTKRALGAVRGMLSLLHNGGQPLQRSTPIYTTVEAEEVRDGYERLQDNWNNQGVDRFQKELLYAMRSSEAGFVIVPVETTEGVLRGLYEYLSIKTVLVVYITSTRKGDYFAEFHFAEPVTEEFIASKKELIRRFRNIIYLHM